MPSPPPAYVGDEFNLDVALEEPVEPAAQWDAVPSLLHLASFAVGVAAVRNPDVFIPLIAEVCLFALW
jgi:hypothetical protein